ncbi:MAG: polysaccharide biosynthesis/export family protein [Pseudomonadota bacterium]|nr:polysaccharide biosynthesis/export family protein [Pseudomonadota bacterium]
MWFCLLTALAAHAAENRSADVLTYPLGAGDEVRIDVVGELEMSGVFRIGVDGAVDIPYGGRVPVAGLTVDEATRAITAHLAKNVLARPQVVLDMATYGSRMVNVTGGVMKPDSYAFEKGHTMVSDLLVRAGGLTDASATRAAITREVAGVVTNIPVDLERINAGDAAADLELRAGDRLYVPQVESVFVDGQVQKPGAISYRDGMTITQAITQAGSTLGTARKTAAYIMRGGERIPVNLKRIQSGEESDIVLRPSDRVYIPESAF